MAELEVTCDNDGMAYISLTDASEPHEVHESVPLYGSALD
jgi:hypothetical protein